MFGFSMGEMILLMAIALIAIGPKQLPEVARTLGKFMNELKRATGDFTKTFTDVRDDTQKTWSDARKGMNDVFTAGAAAYTETVRAPPPGTVSNRSTAPINGTPTAADASSSEVALSDAPAGFELDPQGSLFIPTDLSNVTAESAQTREPSEPVEEQLSFQLTSFDDEPSTL